TQAVLDTITTALASEEKVQILGFGTFEVRERSARTGRNPQTGLNPFIGFTVPNIPVDDFVVVTYQEVVTSIPEGGTIVNFVDV
ncbi:HU family DNA-binding protein, partial [Bacillus cereus]